MLRILNTISVLDFHFTSSFFIFCLFVCSFVRSVFFFCFVHSCFLHIFINTYTQHTNTSDKNGSIFVIFGSMAFVCCSAHCLSQSHPHRNVYIYTPLPIFIHIGSYYLCILCTRAHVVFHHILICSLTFRIFYMYMSVCVYVCNTSKAKRYTFLEAQCYIFFHSHTHTSVTWNLSRNRK